MRMHRIITGFVAIALAGSVSFVTTSSEAAPAAGHTDSSSTVAAPAARALPAREISEKIVDKGKLIFKGKVKGRPHYSHQVVKIQRKVSRSGTWKPYTKTKTGQLGGFKARVAAGGTNCNPVTGKGHGCWYYRAVTPKTERYRKSYSAGNYFTYRY